ncbi:hypothetical protein RGQ29_018690 [Quercus rubra]|uniref:C-type mannose receptor 2 n=2 Tax=Quercus TaxID=3511 RepID=A0A7N2LLL7_QUELO|nr:uncharacterized protein LOC115983185 [Quercus lobata]XP_050278631.1 uncharacterized protein LOC126720339 [Quercus robur]KAK4595043.1 hypothetical protein RGQ29_018690 [Quercus rubra]
MGSKMRRKQQVWYVPQPLTPLMEWPDPEMQEEGNKKESSWEVIREWFRATKNSPGASFSSPFDGAIQPKKQDLRLLLGVLGCPLAPIPLVNDPIDRLHIKDIPMETSIANYIIQQYLAATGCLKQQKCAKTMYATGTVKMICCETEVSSGKNVKTLGTRSGENGCFVLWQMLPGKWSLDLVVGGNQVIAGSDGKIVWRHTSWLGTHAAKGPQRPLRRIIQGLDPKTTASLFANAQCLGEKRLGHDDCFVLKVCADRAAVMERNDGSAEVIRHVLYGYFCQKSGLLVYLEDSHLTRVQTPENEIVYWETTIGSSIGDYRDVDGVLIAHQGRSIATVFRFGELSQQHTRTRMEEVWTIDDVVYNVPGLSLDYFIPPADIVDNLHSP